MNFSRRVISYPYLWQVLDSFAHNWLSKSNATPEHACSDYPRGCQAPKHAQGPHFWDQWALIGGTQWYGHTRKNFTSSSLAF